MTQPYPSRPATQRPAPLAIFRAGRRLAAAGLLALALVPVPGRAQGPAARPGAGFFQSDAAARSVAATSPQAATRARSQALTLDEPGLRAALATAPPEGRAGAAPLVLALPRPDGTSARFALREAPIMEAPLAARYPMIKTYAGSGLDDATATVRLDLSPAGFHAQVLSGIGRGFDIDPVSPTDKQHYLSSYQQDVRPAASQRAGCGTVPTPAEERAGAARLAAWRAAGPRARLSGAQLRTYRLALTCTPEYAVYKGNTVVSVLAAEVATLNRVVGVFEREIAVRFVLVANNDQLIFLSGTGPQPAPALTNSNQGFALLGENQLNVDRIIGDANYDLGHIICTSGGGVASLGVVCEGGRKARGVSADDVKVIYHEMGHQLGAYHTFNTDNSNRTSDSAWEPGSGTTIMSYGGLFGAADDVQSQRDDVFHTGSYEQMQATMSSQGCGTSTATGNAVPVVTAPAGGKTLPLNTPFQLTATATDADNDPLTYSWEELDLGPAGNLTMPQVTGETPPLFRTFPPVTSPTRYFPHLAELVNNTVAPGERLPTVARTLKFRCTARDAHNGTAGVVGGVDYSALVTLSVSAAAGPFLVTAPNAAGLSWASGSTQTVRWDVAKTDLAPVSCAKVNLRLSLDGGLSYPLTLASNINNNGTASITVPNLATTQARLLVEAADNYFFDISNVNFTITPGPGPAITSFTPASGPMGTKVTLTGTNLAGATAVTINGTAATNVTVVSATSITATVAVGSTSGLITVTTPLGIGVSGTAFTVIPLPALTALSPATGVVGTVLTGTGTDLSGATAVTFTSATGTATPAPAGFGVASGTRLTDVRVPATLAAGTYSVTVTTPIGRSNGLPFTVLPFVVGPAPTITSIVRPGGTVGATIRLVGTGLHNTTQITFGGSSGNVVRSGFAGNAAGTEITGVVVPAGAATGPLTVTTPNGTSPASAFTVYALPVAQAQNVSVRLDANGRATLAASAVNNGSTASDQLAGASMLSLSPNTFSAADVLPAPVARALSFDGTKQQYVAIGGGATVPMGNSPYTIEAWVKPTTMGRYGIIGWGFYGGLSTANALTLSARGLVNYWWARDIEVATPSLAGAWHHVAATCDGTTRTLYLDGKAIGSDKPDSHNVAHAGNLRIGSTNFGEYFDGSIDEVRVWNLARTPAQLSAGQGISLTSTTAGLVAYYRFSEGSGTTTATATVISPAANVGTLTNGPTWTTDAPALVSGVPVTLTVTDIDGNSSTVQTAVTVLPATATATAGATTTAFSVWPNPVGAKGLLHISLPVPATAASATLRNALGQLVRTRAFAGSATELPTAGLAPGLYLLRVQADGYAPALRRVVVE